MDGSGIASSTLIIFLLDLAANKRTIAAKVVCAASCLRT